MQTGVLLVNGRKTKPVRVSKGQMMLRNIAIDPGPQNQESAF